MKKLIVVALILMLMGCASEAPKQSEQAQWVDNVYRAVTKYEIIHGTQDEQAKPPITDEQVKALQNFLKGTSGNVHDNVYKP
jgi:hypothetical protein